MTPVDARQVLRQHGWLSTADAAFADAILKRATWRKTEPGGVVQLPGDALTGLVGIAGGTVELK